MTELFDMRRLHHGCGESLLVRPLKVECIARPGGKSRGKQVNKARNLSRLLDTVTPGSERPWE